MASNAIEMLNNSILYYQNFGGGHQVAKPIQHIAQFNRLPDELFTLLGEPHTLTRYDDQGDQASLHQVQLEPQRLGPDSRIVCFHQNFNDQVIAAVLTKKIDDYNQAIGAGGADADSPHDKIHFFLSRPNSFHHKADFLG